MDDSGTKAVEAEAGTIVEEVRFAVVMYGGISLCVYMNGIMQQLLHLVRSTARGSADAADGDFLVPDDEAMAPIERVYRRLALARTRQTKPGAKAVDCRFVVDILSGTSAGGLNNLFLARALANEEPVSALTELWIREGEIGSLFNDARSEDLDWGILAESPPESLLNSRRMAQRLLEAMRTMERQGEEARRRAGEGPKPRPSRLVRRLDLYMTATDLEGIDLSLRIASDESITEKRHRAVFHFVHDPTNVGYLADQKTFRNDFDPRMTPFLTFVSRATSSIVPAFEPVRLDDMAGLQDPGPRWAWYSRTESPLQYSPFFRDFWSNAEVLQIEGATERKKEVLRRKKLFAFRPFGDGGYGDNYPFGYAIDEVSRRQSDYRVDRKFLYIEPDPDLAPRAATDADGVPARPNVVAHLRAMQGVKSTETIREDITRLRDQNRLLERLGSVRLAAASGSADAPSSDDAYRRLKASSTTDELALVFANALGFEADTPYGDATRAIVKAIRQNVFERAEPGDKGMQKGTERFLKTFDLATLRRWTKFEQRAIAAEKAIDAAGLAKLRELNAIGAELRRVPVLLEVAAARDERAEPDEAGAMASEAKRLTTNPNAVRSKALIDFYCERHDGAEASAEPKPADVAAPIEAFLRALASLGPLSVGALARLVIDHPARWTGAELPTDPAPDKERVDAAWRLVTGTTGETGENAAGRARVDTAVDALAKIYFPAMDRAVKRLETIGKGRKAFEAVDRVMFPVLYGNGDAESGRIDILRVSPLDCRTLVEEPKKAKTKLAGTGLGHFSGFFKDSWRAEDVLWGRLDGAERLICTVLSEDVFARRALILQAQLAILAQEDLDRVVDDLQGRKPPNDVLPPESRIRALRGMLLVRALDRFAQWASEASEEDGSGTKIAVMKRPKLQGLFTPKGEDVPLSAAERNRLLAAAWEGLD